MKYHARIVLDAFLMLIAIWLVVVAASVTLR